MIYVRIEDEDIKKILCGVIIMIKIVMYKISMMQII